MTDHIARHQPEPNVPPDHPFQKGNPNFCEHEVYRLASGYPVLCGLRRNQHAGSRIVLPEPKDGP